MPLTKHETRTTVVRVSPTSQDTIVREGGLEPPRPCGHQHLKLARLPFRHSRKVEFEA